MWINDMGTIIKYAQMQIGAQLHYKVLTVPGYNALYFIRNNEGCNQEALVAALHIDKANVARLVERLEKEGCVLRSVNSQNRREVRLSITERGSAVWEDFNTCIQAWSTELMSNLTDQQRQNFFVTVQQMAKKAKEIEKQG